jgi:hypothetical protein
LNAIERNQTWATERAERLRGVALVEAPVRRETMSQRALN